MLKIGNILLTAIVVLLIAYLTAISSRDLVRLIISLELMFGSVFLVLIPMFSIPELVNTAFSILIIVIFTCCAELLVLIASVILLDKMTNNIHIEQVSSGGDQV